MENNVFVSVPVYISKSNPGKMDADGNYIFEVEASNENLDLQNQKILADALQDSKEYFLSNGVVSDDHQHRQKTKDGEICFDYDKVIGEPISVRREGKRTFVKGKLYGLVEAAKPFIKLLKCHSSRVKASVGGILPTIIENPDGTQTITKFMWNDLALTCSPVNSTVAPAAFAKSITANEFCKALSAGFTVNPAEKTGGSALIGEDLEGKSYSTNNIDTEEDDDDEEEIENIQYEDIPELNKSISANSIPEAIGKADELNDVIQDVIFNIKHGIITTEDELKNSILDYGYSDEDATTIIDAIKSEFEQEEDNMMKFTEKMNGIFKSLSKKNCSEVEKSEPKDEDQEIELDEEVDIDDESDDEDEEDDDDSKVEKSLDDYIDATEIMESIQKSLDEKDRQIEELQKSLVGLGEIMAAQMGQPQVRKSVMGDISVKQTNGYVAPTADDFEEFKAALCKAKAAGEVDLRKSVHLESVFQQELRGIRMNPEDHAEVVRIHNKYN